MYKLIELAGEQDAHALSVILEALADSQIDDGRSPGDVCVKANKSGHIIIGLTSETAKEKEI